MSTFAPSLSSSEGQSRGSGGGFELDFGLLAGLGVLALGAGLFAFGVFHGFQNGSCSTTGYSGQYGPVQHCGKGIGWWMLIVTLAIFVAGAGAMMSGAAAKLGIPVLFIAIGVSSAAIALHAGNTHLLLGGSSGDGKLFAGIFGACFVIAGGVWGVVGGRGAFSGISGGSRFAGLLAFLVGVGLAFAITTGVASAIGSSAPAGGQQASGGLSQSVIPTGPSRAAKTAVTQATSQVRTAEKLATCVAAAGTNVGRIQRCEAKYTP